MQRATQLFAFAVLATSLAACAGGGTAGTGLMPQAHMRAQADTLGGGPVFSAPPPEQQRVKPGDTLGGGPVLAVGSGN